jgi:raffinose/stachyose/melibiose transport system permease protein
MTLPDTAPAARGSRTRERPSVATSRAWLGRYLFLLPATAIVVGVVYYSVGFTVWASAMDWDGISPDARFVGLGNYARAFGDPAFWGTLAHTALFSLVIPIQMALGLAFAVALHSRVLLGPLYKVILFLPVVLSPAVMAPVFRRIFDAEGPLNQGLEAVGLGNLAHPWLADPSTALAVVMLVNVWQWTGFSFMLYHAGLTQIDQSIFDAARLDGAGNLAMVRHIVVPMLSGTHLTLAVLGVIGAFKTFDVVFLITGGGPAGSTEFLSTYIYKQAIGRFDMGYASALSILLLVISVAIAVRQLRPRGGRNA